MKVIDFQLKIICIAVAVCFAFDNLDAVINTFDFGSGYREEEIVKYTGKMAAHLSGETGQLYYPGAESFMDPVI